MSFFCCCGSNDDKKYCCKGRVCGCPRGMKGWDNIPGCCCTEICHDQTGPTTLGNISVPGITGPGMTKANTQMQEPSQYIQMNYSSMNGVLKPSLLPPGPVTKCAPRSGGPNTPPMMSGALQCSPRTSGLNRNQPCASVQSSSFRLPQQSGQISSSSSSNANTVINHTTSQFQPSISGMNMRMAKNSDSNVSLPALPQPAAQPSSTFKRRTAKTC